MDIYRRLFPGLGWLEGYRHSDLTADLLSGITIAFILIPQGMAYAMVAGLPAEYGLYATVIPPVIYALFGTSNKISIGPVALDSILIITGLSLIAEPGSADYLEKALLLTFMVGIIQAAFGFARMGFIADFLSYPVILGYVSAAALSIMLSQMGNLLGVSIAGENFFQMLSGLAARFSAVNSAVFICAVLSLSFLLLGKRMAKKMLSECQIILSSLRTPTRLILS